MRNEKRMFGGLVVLIVISSLAVILLIQQNRSLSEILRHKEVPKIGDKAYLFTEKTLDGSVVSNRDTTTLLVFMNAQCQSCAKSLPVVNAAYDSLQSLGIQVIGVISEPELIARSYIKRHNLKFSVIADMDKIIFTKYFVHYVICVVLIDHHGKIQYYQGYGESINTILNTIIEN